MNYEIPPHLFQKKAITFNNKSLELDVVDNPYESEGLTTAYSSRHADKKRYFLKIYLCGKKIDRSNTEVIDRNVILR